MLGLKKACTYNTLLYKDSLIVIFSYLQCTKIYRSKPEAGIDSTDPTLSPY